jgi:hypothetical protein
MHLADISKTAIITPFGLFEYTRMPFGLHNSGQTFQRLMDKVLKGLEGVFCYLDDILIPSADEQQHFLHLAALFQRLQESSLVLNAQKCHFGASSMEFLGHKVDTAGATPLADKVEAVQAMPPPATVKQRAGIFGHDKLLSAVPPRHRQSTGAPHRCLIRRRKRGDTYRVDNRDADGYTVLHGCVTQTSMLTSASRWTHQIHMWGQFYSRGTRATWPGGL